MYWGCQLRPADRPVTFKAKVAKTVPLVAGLVHELLELAPKAAPLQAKLESFFRPRPRV